MRNIKYICFFFIAALFIAVPVSAQLKGDVAVTSGGSSSESNSTYTNAMAVGQSILASGATMDNRVVSGIMASLLVNNESIIFSDVIPSPNSISSSTVVNIGVTVTTTRGTIREVKYKKHSGSPPTDADTYVNVPISAGQTTVNARAVLNDLPGGKTYVQWYAQNTIDEDGNTNTYMLQVEGIGRGITITQPGSVTSKIPVIAASIVSEALVTNPSNVKIQISQGAHRVYERTGANLVNGVQIFDVDSGTIKYTYDGTGSETLQEGASYTLTIVATDDASQTFSESVNFKVSSEAIADLVPFPSPYNPKNGEMTIRYVLSNQSSVTINIYDRAGRLVSQVLNSESRAAGENNEKWNAKNYSGDSLANGIYICEIITKSGGKENRRYKSFAILRK